MFKSLQDFFSSKISTANNKPSDTDIKLAAATLMFELIRSDGTIDEIERNTMNQILSKQFDITDEDCQLLYDLAQKTAEDAVSLQGFTREICDNWNTEQREKLIENLWVLALADNTIDAHERHLVRKVAGLLYLNDAQIIKTRENAKRIMQAA